MRCNSRSRRDRLFAIPNTAPGSQTSRLAALFGYDFGWKISDRLALSQNSNMVAAGGSSGTVFVDSRSTTFDILSALEAKVSDRLTTRLSYEIKYDSNPPPPR